MSNYRRLISYIYAYEGGVKGKNIGYAKVEVRGDQCRIQVNVKKVYVGSNDIGVYLLSPGTELLLGKIFIRGGTGEFRISVSADNVEGSGYNMDQCYGLTVHDVESTWQCYTTIWEDAVAQTAEIQLAEVTTEHVKAKEEISGLSVSEEIEKELETEEIHMESEVPWRAELPEPATDTQPESESEPVIQPQPEPQLQPQPEPRQQPVTVPEMPEPGNPEELKKLDQLEAEEDGKHHIWNQLGGRYARVLAFESENGCEILSIKPQDIGILPREIWVYGNNSFLLHGYYNYRHLILAKLHNPGGTPRYLLGVPGHYYSNEKYMASMFGFPHFVLAKRQPEDDGRFGYWYTDIRL